MKILETDQGWALEHNGKTPIAIEGESYFTDKDVLAAAVEKRGLFIWQDGSIEKTPEDSSGAPATEDPPTDPNAQPNDPDPNPVSPPAPKPKPEKASGGKISGKQAKEISEKLAVHKGDNILRPEQVEAMGGKKAVEKLSKAAKKPAASAEDPAKPRRGRPPKYTPEEAERRRKEQAKKYAAERTPEQKAAARERARRWRENNPDKVKEARKKSMEKRAERYQTDPQFRDQFNQYQREYKRSKREETD
ncbi:hypothetical protein SEA_MAGRITTE_224 [Microbacterium phage Magritte]|nr:hypothetical protein SEA_MAGRITTE_224 [Microbacterium phage Magritte]